MDPLTISAIIQGGGALFKGINAIGQNAKAKKLERQYKRPIYKVPGAMNESVANAQNAYMNPNLRGHQLAAQRLGGASAQAMRSARESGAGSNEMLAALSGININQNRGLADLAMAAQNDSGNRQRALQSALGQKAGYQDKAFDYNKAQPYGDAMDAAAALRGASRQNMYGAVTDGMKIGGNLMNAGSLDLFKDPKINEFMSGVQQGVSKSGNSSYTGTQGGSGYNPHQMSMIVHNLKKMFM